ncbi:MAG: hypothetical protein LBT59_29135 [Clostridiales bacterium]|jgi:hypothetical protein|nr:hypothetical protein [Clostridiales bacterium]
MELKLIGANSVYEFNLEHKITLLTGMSGIGKSVMFDTIREIQFVSGKMEGIAPEQVKLIDLMPENVCLTFLNSRDYELCIIDSDGCPITKKIAKAINSTPFHFLIIQREITSMVPLHYKAVVHLENSDNYHKAVKTYDHISGQELDLSLPTVVEDTGGGLEFFSWCANHVTGSSERIWGAEGYGMISARVNNLFVQVPKVQIVANAATFGSVIGNIEHLERTSLFLPECVEEVFLKCPIS